MLELDGRINNRNLKKCVFFIERETYRKISELSEKHGKTKSCILRKLLEDIDDRRQI